MSGDGMTKRMSGFGCRTGWMHMELPEWEGLQWIKQIVLQPGGRNKGGRV
ncbi:hypothetical protein HanRHA438_Chr12g0541141 [Helianthus annuus]|nr:hypothetical protein HanHA300_Chr12g0433831 [Helianthus annuus]KAJ0504364.1 hypothetical protein HanHA89_Chr12g0458481 [Helianthus annuus]KAJ0674073.1 hypothetical protein HanLR1_Chr12g0435961 [Helianthus annuus]KAJ0865496.1 hypothetical protein HanRHA438_Chr12g0541141 [Helianthus annuus]